MKINTVKKILSLLGLFAGVGLPLNGGAVPAQVILIRHGEKPLDDKNMSLSENGSQRAKALALLFEKRPELKKSWVPTALFASAYIPGNGTKRPIETLTPLSETLHLKIDSSYARDDYEKLAQSILTNPMFDKKTIMISWVHTFIPKLAKALGSSPAEKWDDAVYDRLWLIHFNPSGSVTSEEAYQKLLPGDSQ